MTTLTIQLATGETFILSKQWILDFLPESILADALRNEPDLTYLQLNQPVVTSDVMQLLVNLSQGIEPSETLTGPLLSQVQAAHRYLNIPAVLAYTTPYYNNYLATGDVWNLKNAAIVEDNVPFYRFLLWKGAVAQDADMVTAIAQDAPKIMAFLLTLPQLDPSSYGTDQWFLEEAVRKGRLEIVRLLLEDPRVDPTVDDNVVLMIAVEKNNTPMLRLLLQDPRVDPTANDYEALNEAARKGYANLVSIFLADPRIDPSSSDTLYIASEAGFPDVVRVLLADPRVDPTADDNAALINAIVYKWDDIVRLLLADPRVDPSLDDDDALIEAIDGNNTNAVALLLAHPRIDPTADNNRAIQHAVGKGRVDIYQMLLADPRVRAYGQVSIL